MLARPSLTQACVVVDTVHPRISNWINISIEGGSREAVAETVAQYRITHAGCEPAPAFYDIQTLRQGGYGCNGSRGRDPLK